MVRDGNTSVALYFGSLVLMTVTISNLLSHERARSAKPPYERLRMAVLYRKLLLGASFLRF